MLEELAAKVVLVDTLRELNTLLVSRCSGVGSLRLSPRSSEVESNRQTTRCESVKEGKPKERSHTAKNHQSVSSSCRTIRDFSVSIESTGLPLEKLLTTFSAKKSHFISEDITLQIPPFLERGQSVVLSHFSPLWCPHHRHCRWSCRCVGHY